MPHASVNLRRPLWLDEFQVGIDFPIEERMNLCNDHRLSQKTIQPTFDSGSPVLDRWFAAHALQNQESGVSRTYVVREAGAVVYGN